jgi:succinate dehydrogenase / fumarate reductase cytochrome b subunit
LRKFAGPAAWDLETRSTTVVSLTAAVRSSIGAKLVMAVTGLGLILFVIGHMLGNLQVFLGPDALNHYAEKLRSVPGFLWAARIGLLVFVVLHAVSSVRVALLNRAARPQRYVMHKKQESSYAARTLIYSGILIVAYVVYHLLHFTTRDVHTQYVQVVNGHVDVYRMVVGSFQNPVIAITYTVAMVLVAMHLSHAIGGFLQTLGFTHPRYSKNARMLGPVLATLICIGYVSIPIAVLLGVVQLPAGGH